MKRRPTLPDFPRIFNLNLAGSLSTLGHAVARGRVSGTGFVAHGHEIMQLTLKTATGTITIRAHSARVPGFTVP